MLDVGEACGGKRLLGDVPGLVAEGDRLAPYGIGRPCGSAGHHRDPPNGHGCRVPLLVDTPFRQGDVLGVGIEAHVVALGTHCGHGGRPRSHERIEDQVTPVGVELDQPSGELDRKRRRVADPGGRLRRHVPDIGGGVHELVHRHGAFAGQAGLRPLLGGDGSVEASLGGDDDPLGNIS